MMNEIDTSLHNKICNASSPVAVFVINGKVKNTKITTDLFRQAMEKMPEKLMGVYDKGCAFEWLMEDLEYMGVS